MARALMDRARADTSAATFQDALILIKLRNALIHQEPSTISRLDTDPALRRRRAQGVARNPFIDHAGQPWDLNHVLSAAFASWAAEAALAFVTDFVGATGSGRTDHLTTFAEQP
jgi:hypothetical protein